MGFPWPVYSRLWIESSILSSYGSIKAKENPYSGRILRGGNFDGNELISEIYGNRSGNRLEISKIALMFIKITRIQSLLDVLSNRCSDNFCKTLDKCLLLFNDFAKMLSNFLTFIQGWKSNCLVQHLWKTLFWLLAKR